MAERVALTPPRPSPLGPRQTTTPTPPTETPAVDGTALAPDPAPAAAINPNPLPRRPTETYVVQFPREQIYRVPPPENAKLVEKYRDDHNNRRQRRPIIPWLKWAIGIALVLAILAGIVSTTYRLVVGPADPSFSVARLALRNPNNPRAGSPRKLEYDFTMRVENPSLRMGYSYGAGGKAVLAHDGADVAVGKSTQAFEQGYQNTTTFRLVLRGSRVALPKQIQRSLKGSKDVIPMSLAIKFSVGKTIGKMVIGNKSMDVTCDIKVSGLAKEARIVSQECETKFT